MLGLDTLPPPAARSRRGCPQWRAMQAGGTPRCHPVRCRSRQRRRGERMAADSGQARRLPHSPMVLHWHKEAWPRLTGRFGATSSREEVTSPHRQRGACAVAWRRGGGEGTRGAMAGAESYVCQRCGCSARAPTALDSSPQRERSIVGGSPGPDPS